MYLRRLLVVLLAAPVASAALSIFPVASEASVGVGVQAGPVRLGAAAQRGGNYALPPVYVVNTGTQAEFISVRIERLSRGSGLAVPPTWIHAGPGVQLPPHRAARIPLELNVPDGARPGAYVSDVVAAGSVTISVGSANLGVAAATKLEFSVGPGSAPALGPGVPGWTGWAAGALLLLAIAVAGLRRAGFQIRVERTTVGHSSAERQEGHNEA